MCFFSSKDPSQISHELCDGLREPNFPNDFCGVSAFAAEAPERLAAETPPGIGDADNPVEVPVEVDSKGDSEDKVPERVVKLRDQAMTLEHRLFDFPKTHSVMFVTKLVCFHDVLEENHVIPIRSPILSKHQSSEKSLPQITFMCSDALDKTDKTYVVLCLRDKYTDIFDAFPGTDHSPASIVSSLRKFVGRRVCSKLVILVSDAADEFVAAADEMG